MINSDIKYETSQDYDMLRDLLKKGIYVIGFKGISIDGFYCERCKVIAMHYDYSSKVFDLGFSLFEEDLDVLSFNKVCLSNNIFFIEPNVLHAK